MTLLLTFKRGHTDVTAEKMYIFATVPEKGIF